MLKSLASITLLFVGSSFTAEAAAQYCFKSTNIKSVLVESIGEEVAVKYARKGAGAGKVKVSAYYLEQPLTIANFRTEMDAQNWIVEVGTELKGQLCLNTPECQANSYLGAQIVTDSSKGASEALIHKVVCKQE